MSCLWLAACAQRGCGGGDDGPLAVMTEHSGDVQRDHAAKLGVFEPVQERATFASGDGLRTAEHAQARLELPSSGSVLVQAGTTIRMWRGARGERPKVALKVQTGAAEVVAVQPIELQTELGVAVLQAGSELSVRPGLDGQVYAVELGRALLMLPDGKQRKLAAGETLGAELPSAAPAPRIESAPAPAPTPAPATDSGIADLELRLGTTASIYDPTPPTRVQFSVPDACTEGVLLTWAGETLPLAPTRVLTLEPGSYDYHAECARSTEPERAGRNLWRGTLRVLRHAGTVQLPRTAPTNAIDADGRSYTVLFQNLPPVLQVRWPAAPEAASYALAVQLEGGATLGFEASKPEHVFAASELPEGRHQLQFSTRGRPREIKSRPTTVDLRFDNASPMASLRAPPVSGFEPGTRVHVAGLALPGAQVSVLGQPLRLDAQQRFAGELVVPPGSHAIAVRIQHPRTGTRYYVRRVRPSP